MLPIFNEEAEIFINTFIDHAVQVYGEHFVSYNVHALKHLVNECRNHGNLESFSAFPYENPLKTIKQMLKTGYLPFYQIVQRISEQTNKVEVLLNEKDNSIKLLHRHKNPDEAELGQQFREVCINNVTLKISEKDSCFMTTDGTVVILENIISRGRNTVILIGRQFNHSDDFYTYSINSSQLGIMKVWEINDIRESFSLEDVFGKRWLR